MDVRERQRMPSGFLLINKPPGPTSHDIVERVRAVTGIRRVGHAGTLDPFAQGLLIVGVGREATKRLDRFKALPKTYRALLYLGATSTTGDPTGEVREHNYGEARDKGTIEAVLRQFVGTINQTPPMYSAKKIRGRKLYEIARKGGTIDRPPVSIAIAALSLIDDQWPLLTIEVTCSAGTYIRQLAADIGERLGTGAYCQELLRTRIGAIALEHALCLSALGREHWAASLKPIDFLATL